MFLKKCEKKHFENVFGKNVKKCISKMWKNVKKCEKCGNMLKNRKLHVSILLLSLKKTHIHCEPIDMNHWKWKYAYVES